MKRHIVSLVATAAAVTLAPRANAAPDLVASDAPPGWSYPALPRSSGDATSGSCGLQAPALPGESASTWFNGSMHNIGTNTAPGAFQALYLDDALKTLQGPYNVLPLGFGSYVNVPSSLVIKGGRHTLLSRADVFGGVAETNEGNNDWVRQYIWSPLALTAGTSITRTGDPSASSSGSGPWLNAEGFSATTIPGQWWFAIAVVGTASGADFDIRLHDEAPSNVPQAGFGSYTAWSGWYTDHLDAVIINRNVAPAGTYYAGVANWSAVGNKVVQFEAAPPTYISAPGVYGPFTMAANDIIDLHELYAFTSDLLQIEVVPLAGDADLSFSLIGTTGGGVAGLQDNVASADNNPGGYTESTWVTLAATHFHGLVVYKHGPADVSKYCTYEIRVSPYPNLVADHIPPGWDSQIVPRNDDSAPFPLTLPPTLNGDQPTTSFNYGMYNHGPGTASAGFYSRISVDDEPRWDRPQLDPVYLGNYGTLKNTPIGGAPSIVKGGRHYLRSDFDNFNVVPELAPYETDNWSVDWFVWSPSTLVDQVPVERSAPPYAYPSGVSGYPASDGLRSSLNFRYWTAVGVMPITMGAEYDMALHTPSAGSKSGFADALIWSWDTFPGNPDFVIVNYNVAPWQQYDFSVVNGWGYSDAYEVQQADAPFELSLTPGMSRLGPFTLGAFDVLDMHEFYVGASMVGVPVYISANNLSGGVDLEIWAFDGLQPYHTKFTAMAGMNANGPGGDEHLPVIYFDHAGYYALAVNKSKATDNGNAANYELVFSAGQSSVDAPVVEALPAEFGLSAPRPNPSSAGTSVELAVPSGQGNASVVVYDLSGRRVRTLANGESTPGRHVLTWDGRDASGGKAAAGVYFVKLETARVHETKKITLLR